MSAFQLSRIPEINKEWWILLSMFIVSAILNSFGAVNQMLLLLYTLPTLLSAYFLGRRHATLTAFASVFMVVCGMVLHDTLFGRLMMPVSAGTWWQVMLWAGLLVVFAYATGSLFREMHEMYRAFLLLLRYFLTRDSDSHDRLRRLAYTSAIIAKEMDLNHEGVENVRSAALLSDLHEFDLNPDIVRKLARLSATAHSDEIGAAKEAGQALARLRAVLPIILEKKGISQEEAALESRIIMVAEEFDSLTRDAERRTALAPAVARNLIARAGSKFDSSVVDAFLSAYDDGKLVSLYKETASASAS